MGNTYSNKVRIFFSFKVKFTREIPNDFYISGDQVEGIIELTTNETNELNSKYGSLHIDLIGEVQDFKKHKYQRYTDGVEIFFLKKTKLIPISKIIQEKKSLRIYRWTFHGTLDSFLPSSLPPQHELDPCICYYAYAYFDRNSHLTQKSSFLVFSQSPTTSSIPNSITSSSMEYKSVKLHCHLLNQHGLVVPGKKLSLKIELINPFEQLIKTIRVKLQQYRYILNQETDLNILSFAIPDFESETFQEKYHLSTYELIIPLDKCRLMAPTSHYKHVRYELQIECCLIKKNFFVKLPVICTTDHQTILNLPQEFQSIPQVIQYRSQYQENKSPPSYRDFIASEILPQYHELFP